MSGAPDSPTLALLTDPALAAAERSAQLVPLVYDELRRMAQRVLLGERPGHTLQATALVHEAFLRLVGPRQLPWQSRSHFFAAAAEAMRRIVVDHARARATHKRGGAEACRAALVLDALPDPESGPQNEAFLVLDAAIEQLALVYPDAAEVVRLRYFAGLGVDEAAAALGVSAPTVKRTWAFARAWLREAIERQIGSA
ncbi:MAG: ECF-type sigma factor [Planctomycetes bacterium]|jgi:RNA polymerase sigma factor (TIGR02999 family)|nr:ECF-type sigma factor [Planctomycetota bacterium]